MRALRTFEQYSRTGPMLLAQHLPDGSRIFEDGGCDLQQVGFQLVLVDGADVEAASQRIVMRQQAIQAEVERLRISKIRDPDGTASDLVFVGRTNAPTCGSDLDLAGALLPDPIEFPMNRQDEWRVLGYHQISPG